MKQNEADRVASDLVKKFGLPINATLQNNGQEVYFQPDGVDYNEGFRIRVTVGWRSLVMDLDLGKFAAELLAQMANANSENRNIFSNVASHILTERGQLYMKINGLPADILKPEIWPKQWKSLVLTLKKSPLEINTDDHHLSEKLTSQWIERFYALVISLAPLEEVTTSDEIHGLPEGALKKELVNRYERSRVNRAMCISFHGCVCKVCDMNFNSTYGKIGDGFIHAHHVIPVSKLGNGYVIRPIDDLVPVCPNCHAMLHKKDPPYTVLELKAILATNRQGLAGTVV